jgi:hypothetical protein
MNELNSIEHSDQKWVTKTEVAAHFGCNIRTIGNLMRRKIIPFVKIRGLLRFDLHECEEAMRQYRARPIWERDRPATGKLPPAPSNGASPPPPPEASPPAPRTAGGMPIILQGAFSDVVQLRKALTELFSDAEKMGSQSPPSVDVKSGSWILLLVPSIE